MKIVVLTGAGISAESGIATFRDPEGVWAKYDYQEVATPEGFEANPDLVHEFYNARRSGLKSVEPNIAHVALAALEDGLVKKGGTLTLVTQNVDDLHERAGSKNIIHMHGELTKIRCQNCLFQSRWQGDLAVSSQCLGCGALGGMRPDIVWFGEMPMHMDEISTALLEADHFVSIGTSGSVYPAAGYVAEARNMGILCTELNLEPSENAHLFDFSKYGPAAEVVPHWAENILKE